jgi:hypothetical protein
VSRSASIAASKRARNSPSAAGWGPSAARPRPARLVAAADRAALRSDGTDLAYVAIELRDAAGVLATGADRPVTVVLNKVDRLDRPHTVVQLQAAADLAEEFSLDAEVFPVSARTGKGVGPLVEHLVAHAADVGDALLDGRGALALEDVGRVHRVPGGPQLLGELAHAVGEPLHVMEQDHVGHLYTPVIGRG